MVMTSPGISHDVCMWLQSHLGQEHDLQLADHGDPGQLEAEASAASLLPFLANGECFAHILGLEPPVSSTPSAPITLAMRIKIHMEVIKALDGMADPTTSEDGAAPVALSAMAMANGNPTQLVHAATCLFHLVGPASNSTEMNQAAASAAENTTLLQSQTGLVLDPHEAACLQTAVYEMKTKTETLASDLVHVTQEKEEAMARVGELEEQLESIAKDEKHSKDTHTRLRNELQALALELDQSQEQVAELTSELVAVRRGAADAEKRVDTLQKQMHQAQAMASTKDAALDEMDKRREDMAAKYENELQSLRQQLRSSSNSSSAATLRSSTAGGDGGASGTEHQQNDEGDDVDDTGASTTGPLHKSKGKNKGKGKTAITSASNKPRRIKQTGAEPKDSTDQAETLRQHITELEGIVEATGGERDRVLKQCAQLRQTIFALRGRGLELQKDVADVQQQAASDNQTIPALAKVLEHLNHVLDVQTDAEGTITTSMVMLEQSRAMHTSHVRDVFGWITRGATGIALVLFVLVAVWVHLELRWL